MLRYSALIVILTVAFGALTAFVTPRRQPAASYAFNSTIAQYFHAHLRSLPAFESPFAVEADSTSGQARVLLLSYCAFDSAYVEKMQRLVKNALPDAEIILFHGGSEQQLQAELAECQFALLAYPSSGSPKVIQGYGRALENFAQSGGQVVVAGTHEYAILQQLNLFEIDYSQYVAEAVVRFKPDQPLLEGLDSQASIQDYAYPIDLSDPRFVVMAEVESNPVAGYKPIGQGRVYYLGFEYYSADPAPVKLLTNVLRSLEMPDNQSNTPQSLMGKSGASQRQRNVEVLRRSAKFSVKVYPNPYIDKSALEVELPKTSSFVAEMLDETGRTVALLQPQRQMSAGSHRFELPNVPPGVYFIHCKGGEQVEVRKVVKIASE